MAQFSLWLTKNEYLSLERTSFSHNAIGSQLNAVRGKTAGAYKGYSTFQWTPAVQSLVVLTLRTAARVLDPNCPQAILHGYDGSLASSLDYSIGKTPVWMLDIFGVDRAGTALAKRLFKRTNPERKRSGPVAVCINENILAASEISVLLDDKPILDSNVLLELAEQIERTFIENKSKDGSSKTVTAKVIENSSLAKQQAIKHSSNEVKTTPIKTTRGKAQASKASQAVLNAISCPCCGKSLTISAMQPIAA